MIPRHVFCTVFALLLAASFTVHASGHSPRQIDWVEDWGVEPVHARVTAKGYMVEFRYRIVDAEKARILSDRKDFPFMLSMKSDAKLSVPYFPTVGFIKSNRRFQHEGRNYITMFSNEGVHLLRGDKVRIAVKDQVSPVIELQ